jgi:XTP/dITP diphosphohydrolase
LVYIPPGNDAQPLVDALSAAGGAPGGVRVLPGSTDLPGAHLLDVVATMDTLRVSCPWDRKQTHASLGPSLLEESYEALEVLESGDHQALREELGDVLLNVVFHARIAAERSAGEGGYTIDDIADTLAAKLVRRHPHVFADVSVASADDVNRNWDEIKKAERAAKLAATAAPPSVLDGVVFGQPALALAAQVLRRGARAGFPLPAALLDGAGLDGSDLGHSDLDGRGPATALRGTPGALGDALLRLAAVARELDADPEAELRAAVRRLAVTIRDWELQLP